jgi:hypothetical protein
LATLIILVAHLEQKDFQKNFFVIRRDWKEEGETETG